MAQRLKIKHTYPNDTNLLSWLFIIARNDDTLLRVLSIIQFIRERPHLSEQDVRKELSHLQENKK